MKWLLIVFLVVLNRLPAASGDTDAVSRPVGEPSPIVIAHRGACGYLPEHTLESAAFAHALGADYIEQDCVLTKDGVPVVLHDVTLDDVTDVATRFPDRCRDNGHWYVCDFLLDELRQLRVHERWNLKGIRRFPQNLGTFHICTLREQIELIRGLDHSRGTRTGLYIELKRPQWHRRQGLDVTAAVLNVLAEYGLTDADDPVFLQCFETDELKRLRTELKCRLPLIQLLRSVPDRTAIQEYARVVDGLGLEIGCVLKDVHGGDDPQPELTDVVTVAHQHALEVHVWTVRIDYLPKSVPSAERLLDWVVRQAGADGVFTDHPDIVVRWRESASVAGRPGPFHLLNQKKQPPQSGPSGNTIP